MLYFCCHNCFKSKKCQSTSELATYSNGSYDETEEQEFWVPKKNSIASRGSSEGGETQSLNRKISDVSLFSEASLTSMQTFNILDEVLESLQENEVNENEVEPHLGNLIFTTELDESKGRFVVHLDRASELQWKGTKRFYDTFVKVVMLPSKASRSSRVIKNSLCPHFHEEFLFGTEKTKTLHNKILRMTLFDHERQGRYDAIGHVLVPMRDLNIGVLVRHCLPLRPMSLPIFNLGQLFLSLSYVPTNDKLTVTPLRARDLRLDQAAVSPLKLPMRTDSYQTYVKVTLMCSGEKVKSERTPVVQDPKTPIYNHPFHFVVPSNYLDDTSVVVTVIARGQLKQDAIVGRSTSGPYTCSCDGTLTHWGQMLKEKRSVTEWRTLYL